MGSIVHLAKRWVTSLSDAPPAPVDEVWAESHLSPGELELWRQMGNVDRRHAVLVARRFVERRPSATQAEMVAALLHDVGKVCCGLGTTGRVVATVVGPRTARFRTYNDHEAIGIAMLTAAGSNPATIDALEGRSPASAALRDADDI